MYKILGADGREYGPVSLEQFKQWRTQGRVNAQTRVQLGVAPDWKPASEVPELSALFLRPTPPPLPQAGPPPLQAPRSPAPRQDGLAVASMVLGIVSVAFCLSILTGIPAIICGHRARSRARQFPDRFGGSGQALAGLILGYFSVVIALAVGAAFLPNLATAKMRGRSEACANNLKQLGLAFKVWAIDHGDEYPFNVSTNNGGTREFCAPDQDGYDQNAARHLRVLANEIGSPRVLVCPSDRERHPAADFQSLQAAQVSYRFRSGANINDTNPQEVLAICPIHGHVLHCDGGVEARGSAHTDRPGE